MTLSETCRTLLHGQGAGEDHAAARGGQCRGAPADRDDKHCHRRDSQLGDLDYDYDYLIIRARGGLLVADVFSGGIYF